MKKKQPKLKETEKANAEIETPKNVDYLEISMTHEGLEKVAQENSVLLDQRNDPVLRRRFVRRQEKLLRKVFKAASQVLTSDQFSIFTQRYIYNLPESEISEQLGKAQSYIPRVLKACIKKIQKRLRVPINLKGFSRDRKVKELE
jgi:DNA-directed RNA polymerase specialized sigma subunit